MVRANQTVTDEIPIHKEQAQNTPAGTPWFPEACPHMNNPDYFVPEMQTRMYCSYSGKFPEL